MKTEEAFDELAKRQGGGFKAKRAMAADKLWDKPSVAFDEWWNSDNDESTNPFRLESGAYWAWAGWKAALAQPAQEPVAWRWGNKKLNGGYEWRYTTYKTQPDAIPLYTTPPQRPWVGLTDKEYDEIWRMDLNNKELMDKTIAKLKDKNNGT